MDGLDPQTLALLIAADEYGVKPCDCEGFDLPVPWPGLEWYLLKLQETLDKAGYPAREKATNEA